MLLEVYYMLNVSMCEMSDDLYLVNAYSFESMI